MKTPSLSYLSKKRKTLVERLSAKMPNLIRGSLITTYKKCGKKGCKCTKGRGHGPKYYLSVSQSGGKRPKMEYVPKADKKEVDLYLSNFREIRKILEEISNINREILKQKRQI